MPTPADLRVAFRDAKTRIQSMLRNWISQRSLVSILLLALLSGLIYYFLIPPWWHYDEPGQFEYAWLAANRPTWPQPGDYDQAMRREMAKSMQSYGWYSIRNYKLDLSSNEPIWIGATQTGGQPGYYFLISLPLRLLHNADILTQYDAARLVSLLLYVLTILAVWNALGEVLPEGHPLRWMVAAFLALLPAFVDQMVSINDDVGAVLAASLCLWASLRLLTRGPSLGRLLFFGVTLALCYLVKSTAWFALPLAPLVVVFSLLRGRFTWIIWGATAIGILAGAFLCLQGGQPRAWYQNPIQISPLQLESSDAPLGNHVFQLDPSGMGSAPSILQLMPRALAQSLSGQTVTLGAWMWADQPIQTGSPAITFYTNDNVAITAGQKMLNLDTRPTFYQSTFAVPADIISAIVIINYAPQPSTGSRIFLDGLVLAKGEYSDSPPHFADPNGARGAWGGQNFQNLIRNGSAEQGSIRLRPWVNTKLNQRLGSIGVDLPLVLTTLQDWQGNGRYYRTTLSVLNRTFWADLAGDKVVLPGNYIASFLAVADIIGLAGAVRLMWRQRKRLRWDVIYILVASLLIAWTLAALRGVSSLLTAFLLSGWARYAYPAIFPTALLLCTGWLEWLNLLKDKLHFTELTSNAIFLGGMLGLSAFAMLNALRFFHPNTPVWGLLALLLLLQCLVFLIIVSRQVRPNP